MYSPECALNREKTRCPPGKYTVHSISCSNYMQYRCIREIHGTLLIASPMGEMQLGLIGDQFRAAVSAVGRTRKPSRTLWRECSTNCRFSWMNQEWIVRNFILCIFSGEEYPVHSNFSALVLLLQYSTYCTNYVVCSHRKG